MGLFCSRPFQTNFKISMYGLVSAGKTSILNYLKNKISDKLDLPYLGSTPYFKFPYLNYKCLTITEFDLGDPFDRRNLHILRNSFKAKGIIFVIDSSDRVGLEDYVLEDYYFILSHEDFKNLPILILANKQDITHALSVEEIIKKISIEKFKEKIWIAIGTSVITGEGIEEGLDWMIKRMEKE